MDWIYQFSHDLTAGFPPGGLRMNFADIAHPAFWLAVGQMVVINFLLSGDNALVISMACRGLPPHRRGWGIAIGSAAAIVLRVAFTIVIAPLMLLPWIKLAGGIALLVIAINLLAPQAHDKSASAAPERLWRAIWVVVAADAVMSLDNVIAVAAAARGDLLLLVLGLALSLPFIVAGATLIMTVLDRFPLLQWLGAALLGWIAGDVAVTDPAVAHYLSAHLVPNLAAYLGVEVSGFAEPAIAAAAAIVVVATGLLIRRRR